MYTYARLVCLDHQVIHFDQDVPIHHEINEKVDYSHENILNHQVNHGNQVHQDCRKHQLFQELNAKKNKSIMKNFIRSIYFQLDQEHHEDQVHPRSQVLYHLK